MIRSLLVGKKFSVQQVEVAMLLLKMFVYYRGPITPSALWVAEMAGCSEKTVDRLVAWLRSEGLISTQRLRHYEVAGRKQPRDTRDRYYSVNKISLDALVKVIAKLLRPALKYERARVKVLVERVDNVLSVKGWSPGGKVPPWQEWFEFKRLLTGPSPNKFNASCLTYENILRLTAQGWQLTSNGDLVRTGA